MTNDRTDKGLREAIRRQPTGKLPSNFTYRTLQRIAQESRLREKRQERRLFLLMLLTCILSGGGCIGYLCLKYAKQLQALPDAVDQWQTHQSMPGYFVPLLTVFVLLGLFNHWLHKRFHSYDQ